MKNTLLSTFTLVLLLTTFSKAEVVTVEKTCRATLHSLDADPVNHVIKIEKNGTTYRAKISQMVKEQTEYSTEEVRVETHQIVHSLDEINIESDSLDHLGLNAGERMLLLAKNLENLSPDSKTGVDLKLVKKVKLFMIGSPDATLPAAIVETYNAVGKNLGSFFYAIFIAPCK